MQDIADDIDGNWDVLAETLGVVDSLLAGGIGVEMRPEVLNLQLKRMLGPPAGTLERHVLEEMGGPVRLVGLGPRSCVYPHADGRCLRMRLGLSGDSKAIRQRRDLGERPWDVVRCRESAQRPLLIAIQLYSRWKRHLILTGLRAAVLRTRLSIEVNMVFFRKRRVDEREFSL